MRRRRHSGALLTSLLAFVFVFLLSMPLFAASPTLSAELKPSIDKKTVTVVFSVENNPGIAAFRFSIHYDNQVLKPTGAAMNGKVTGGLFFDNHQDAVTVWNVVWANGTNYIGNGELCSATFSVIGTVDDGKYPITVVYDPADIINQEPCTCQQILDTNFKKLFSYIVRLHKPYDTLDIAPRNAGQLSPTV